MKKTFTFLKGFVIAFAVTLLSINNTNSQEYNWDELDTMQYRSAALASCRVDNKIYAIGGSDATLHNGQYGENFMQIYDIASGNWSLGSPMLFPRMMLGVAQVNGIIYAIGGGFQNYLSNKVEAYDPLTDTWTEKAPRPKASSCFGTCIYENKIYTFGGTSSTGVFPSYIYDPATNTWSDMAAIPHPSGGLAFAAVNGKIYAIGGVDHNFTCIKNLQVYDIATNSWEEKQSMIFPRFGASAIAVGDKIYVFGGCVFPENIANSVLQIYDIETDSWTSKNNMPIPSQWAAVCCGADDQIYIMGGEDRCMMTYPEEVTIYNQLFKLEISWLGVDDPISQKDQTFNLAPNPTAGNTAIYFNLNESGMVSIELYDLIGKKVETFLNSFMNSGEYNINLDLCSLPSGIYYCSLHSGEKIITRKIIKN